MEPVPFRIGGQIRKVSWLEAYIRVTREKALMGDFQAGKVIIALAKEAELFKRLPAERQFKFTLNIGRPGQPVPTDGAAESMGHEPDFDASGPGNGRH